MCYMWGSAPDVLGEHHCVIFSTRAIRFCDRTVFWQYKGYRGMMALGALKGLPVVVGFWNVTFINHMCISKILMQFEEDRFIIFQENSRTDIQKDRQTDTQINGLQNNTCLFGCVTRLNFNSIRKYIIQYTFHIHVFFSNTYSFEFFIMLVLCFLFSSFSW